MEFVAAIAIAVISGWIGTRIQARSTRRQWQHEQGIDIWRSFITHLHQWRMEVDAIENLPAGDTPSAKTLKRMRQTVWALSPEAPAFFVFASPAINRPATELLSLADDITGALQRGDPLPIADVERFDRLKWEFVMIAAGEFGST